MRKEIRRGTQRLPIFLLTTLGRKERLYQISQGSISRKYGQRHGTMHQARVLLSPRSTLLSKASRLICSYVDTHLTTFQLLGTAAYVYCVVQRSEFWTNLTMYLDGVASGTYQNDLFNPNDPIYGELVYSVSGIEDTQHTLLVTMDDPRSSYAPYNLLLFDRFVYTFVIQLLTSS